MISPHGIFSVLLAERKTAHSVRALIVQSKAPLSTAVTEAFATEPVKRICYGFADMLSILLYNGACKCELYAVCSWFYGYHDVA